MRQVIRGAVLLLLLLIVVPAPATAQQQPVVKVGTEAVSSSVSASPVRWR